MADPDTVSSAFFGMLTMFALWAIFFPVSFGREARRYYDKIRKGWIQP